ncbi:hypothetical protein AVEN_209992-1 [Araneus ventricosus]|uniref:Uncharacterized protein n=1 Tax=Araneus ventricosus TaxID=182803 RepID=A0A4Y2LZQ9_ARAVE|nr:hypothetical protein AVEN_209992-1 [Araneus ventricosus]
MSEHLSIFLRNVRAAPQTLEQQRFFAVPRRVIKCNMDKDLGNADHGNGALEFGFGIERSAVRDPIPRKFRHFDRDCVLSTTKPNFNVFIS